LRENSRVDKQSNNKSYAQWQQHASKRKADQRSIPINFGLICPQLSC
jgi:hypothetical protein